MKIVRKQKPIWCNVVLLRKIVGTAISFFWGRIFTANTVNYFDMIFENSVIIRNLNLNFDFLEIFEKEFWNWKFFQNLESFTLF